MAWETVQPLTYWDGVREVLEMVNKGCDDQHCDCLPTIPDCCGDLQWGHETSVHGVDLTLCMRGQGCSK
jgi:hypothetical protein